MKDISNVVLYKSHYNKALAEITTSAYERHIKMFSLVNFYSNYIGMEKRYCIAKSPFLAFQMHFFTQKLFSTLTPSDYSALLSYVRELCNVCSAHT